jgi:hypothetical protein
VAFIGRVVVGVVGVAACGTLDTAWLQHRWDASNRMAGFGNRQRNVTPETNLRAPLQISSSLLIVAGQGS